MMWLLSNTSCDWCELFSRIPTEVYRPQWRNVLRGYSNDLDWSVDNSNAQDQTTLDNIYTRMKENWECGGFKGNLER